MNKILDIVCLVGWVLLLGFGIAAACGLVTIHPITYICATLMCCSHYIGKIIRGDD